VAQQGSEGPGFNRKQLVAGPDESEWLRALVRFGAYQLGIREPGQRCKLPQCGLRRSPAVKCFDVFYVYDERKNNIVYLFCC